MVSLIAKSEIAKIIEKRAEEIDEYPIIELYPNKEINKLFSSELKSFETNNVIVMKNEYPFSHCSRIIISGTIDIYVKAFTGNKELWSKPLLTEKVDIELEYFRTSEEAQTIESNFVLKTKPITTTKQFNEWITFMNKEFIDLKDFTPADWKLPFKFEQNKNYISLVRKNKLTIKNWADSYTKLEIDSTANLDIATIFVDDPDKNVVYRPSFESTREVKCVNPKMFPRHKMLYHYQHKLEYIPLSTKWIVNQEVQNLKIPFNNIGAVSFSVNAQVITNNNSAKKNWFSAYLTDS